MASEVTDGTVDVRRDRDIAIITLRRERKCNALSTHMETELLRVLRTGEVTTSLAVVVTGGDTAHRYPNTRSRTVGDCRALRGRCPSER